MDQRRQAEPWGDAQLVVVHDAATGGGRLVLRAVPVAVKLVDAVRPHRLDVAGRRDGPCTRIPLLSGPPRCRAGSIGLAGLPLIRCHVARTARPPAARSRSIPRAPVPLVTPSQSSDHEQVIKHRACPAHGGAGQARLVPAGARLAAGHPRGYGWVNEGQLPVTAGLAITGLVFVPPNRATSETPYWASPPNACLVTPG